MRLHFGFVILALKQVVHPDWPLNVGEREHPHMLLHRGVHGFVKYPNQLLRLGDLRCMQPLRTRNLNDCVSSVHLRQFDCFSLLLLRDHWRLLLIHHQNLNNLVDGLYLRHVLSCFKIVGTCTCSCTCFCTGKSKTLSMISICGMSSRF